MTEETKLILDKLEIVGSDVRELKTRVGSLETKMDSLETKVGSLETKVDSLETKVDSLETKMDSLETKVDSLETKVDSLETKVDSLETKMDSLDSKVGVLETDMKRMQLTLENEVDRNIKLIAEGHLDLNRKLTEALKYKEEHELLQVRMNLAEADIKRLKDAVFVSA
ncbi:MAG: DUF2730 family protein [Lachnospiraceae bacterium]|nr:DUF2730 family protein [Lachnospiraceae bacterium]